MTEVWIATEYHGYHFVFSNEKLADRWLEGEISASCLETDELEDNSDEWGRSVYCHGELVGRYERYVVDGHV